MLYGFNYEETSEGYIEIEADNYAEALDKFDKEQWAGNLPYSDGNFSIISICTRELN